MCWMFSIVIPVDVVQLVASEQTPLLHLGQVQIDLGRRETRGPNGELHLTPLEYRQRHLQDRGRANVQRCFGARLWWR